MSADFRRTLLSLLDLPPLASDDDILTRISQVTADSHAIARVRSLADKAANRGHVLDPWAVLRELPGGER